MGIIPIPYWVIRFELDSDSQADKYIEGLAGRKTWLDVCDVELLGGKDRGERGRRLFYGMRRVERKTSAMGSIYTSQGFWDAAMPSGFGGYEFSERLLWIAGYGEDKPYPYLPPNPPYPAWPPEWKIWSMWQKSQRWSVRGISSATDLNEMRPMLHTALRSRSKIPLPNGSVPPPLDPEPPPSTGWQDVEFKGQMRAT